VKESGDIMDDRGEFPLTSDDKDNKEISLDW
jgi:hypothetical protein